MKGIGLGPVQVALALGAAALIGAVLGLVAMPEAAPALLATLAAQWAASAIAPQAMRHPVLWAVVIAVVTIAPIALDTRLAELAGSGAMAWMPFALTWGALNLFTLARGLVGAIAGSTVLLCAAAAQAAATVMGGVPWTPALLAASVPFLAGALLAALLHLRDARQDRVRRVPAAPPQPTAAPQQAAPLQDPVSGTLLACRRALAIVSLRCDELHAVSTDRAVQRAAADLTQVAQNALAGRADGTLPPHLPSPLAGALTADEVPQALAGRGGPERRGEPSRATAAEPPQPPGLSELSDREREILRLVATGATNAEIGRSLYLSEATIKQYVSRLMRRFERDNRTRLALLAVKWFEEPSHPEKPYSASAPPETG
ncbi:response regulator transcription factor [Actinomadura sp. 6N118]|uniref:response regulator transcription factor n=1 Tax=Actinomadura sp. 6N118 TaxID=3375151 RepID=UPI0037B89CEA